MSKVVILSYPGAMDSAVLGLADIIGHGGTETLVIDAPDKLPVTADAVLLPPSKTALHPRDAPWVAPALAELSSAGALVCSACAGLAFVAEAGLDRGRPVTTHPGLETAMRRDWPRLLLETERMVIEHRDLVTAGGLMAWIDLALVVIERLSGAAAMRATARHFIIDPGRRDQRRFRRFQPTTDHGDATILTAQHRLEEDLAEVENAAQLADTLGLSLRSLQRRFKSATGLNITAYRQALRIERARDLLAETARPVGQIAAEVGYGDLPAFHRLFQRETGLTPGQFRRSVQRPPSD